MYSLLKKFSHLPLRVIQTLASAIGTLLYISNSSAKRTTELNIKAVYPKVEIQLCIIHQIRNSCKYISRKDIKEFTTDLKTVYKAIDEKTTLENLDKLEQKW